MIIRNREERSSAVWRFIGVASIPVLLFFIAGFSLGDTSGKEQTANRKMLAIQAAKVDSMTTKVQRYDAFFTKAGAIVKDIEKRTGELESELAAAAKANDLQQLKMWHDKQGEVFEELDDSLKVIKRMFKDLESEAAIVMGMEFLKKHVAAKQMILFRTETSLTQDVESGNMDKVTEALQQLDDQKKEMEKMGIQQSKDAELAELRADLKDCQKERDALQKGTSSSGNQNEKHILAIKTKIDAIQMDMLPNISDKTFANDTKKLTKLKTQISNSLTSISTELLGIK